MRPRSTPPPAEAWDEHGHVTGFGCSMVENGRMCERPSATFVPTFGTGMSRILVSVCEFHARRRAAAWRRRPK